jgi:hypothetical protein
MNEPARSSWAEGPSIPRKISAGPTDALGSRMSTYLNMNLDRSDRLELADQVFGPLCELVVFQSSSQDLTPCRDHAGDVGNEYVFVREFGFQFSP